MWGCVCGEGVGRLELLETDAEDCATNTNNERSFGSSHEEKVWTEIAPETAEHNSFF